MVSERTSSASSELPDALCIDRETGWKTTVRGTRCRARCHHTLGSGKRAVGRDRRRAVEARGRLAALKALRSGVRKPGRRRIDIWSSAGASVGADQPALVGPAVASSVRSARPALARCNCLHGGGRIRADWSVRATARLGASQRRVCNPTSRLARTSTSPPQDLTIPISALLEQRVAPVAAHGRRWTPPTNLPASGRSAAR